MPKTQNDESEKSHGSPWSTLCLHHDESRAAEELERQSLVADSAKQNLHTSVNRFATAEAESAGIPA